METMIRIETVEGGVCFVAPSALQRIEVASESGKSMTFVYVGGTCVRTHTAPDVVARRWEAATIALSAMAGTAAVREGQRVMAKMIAEEQSK